MCSPARRGNTPLPAHHRPHSPLCVGRLGPIGPTMSCAVTLPHHVLSYMENSYRDNRWQHRQAVWPASRSGTRTASASATSTRVPSTARCASSMQPPLYRTALLCMGALYSRWSLPRLPGPLEGQHQRPDQRLEHVHRPAVRHHQVRDACVLPGKEFTSESLSAALQRVDESSGPC